MNPPTNDAGRTRLRLLPLACLLTLLSAPAAAHAERTPPDVAAVEQYRESIPTSSGPAIVGAAPEQTYPLPPAIAERVVEKAAADAQLLERVATSTAFGAPRDAVRPEAEVPLEPVSEWTLDAGARAGASTVADARSDPRIVVLLAACLAIAGVGLASALRRRA